MTYKLVAAIFVILTYLGISLILLIEPKEFKSNSFDSNSGLYIRSDGKGIGHGVGLGGNMYLDTGTGNISFGVGF